MKNIIFTVLLISLMSQARAQDTALPAVAELAAAADGFGTRGGGQTININDRPALRDLVDKTVCRPMSAGAFAAQYVVGLQDWLGRLELKHWYLADAFRREIKTLKMCLTEAPLRSIPTDDQDAVTIFEDQAELVAIRLNNSIYLRMPRYKEMRSDEDRKFLFIHEISHSFIPMDTPRRNESLKSLVATLANPEIELDSLQTALIAARSTIPADLSNLKAWKENILIALNDKLPLYARRLSAEKLSPRLNELAPKDRSTIQNINANIQANEAILFESIKLANSKAIHEQMVLLGRDSLYIGDAKAPAFSCASAFCQIINNKDIQLELIEFLLKQKPIAHLGYGEPNQVVTAYANLWLPMFEEKEQGLGYRYLDQLIASKFIFNPEKNALYWRSGGLGQKDHLRKIKDKKVLEHIFQKANYSNVQKRRITNPGKLK